MLRFFRQIRKRLLTENRFSKYLMYAIGEILLVVIGILIALQINTWNNGRILQKKEVLYLKEIQSNLKLDLSEIQFSIAFNRRKDSIINGCIKSLVTSNSDQEIMSQFNKNISVLAKHSVFDQNRVAFENMLSSENIDVISGDTLRNRISSYYSERDLLGGTQERVKELTRTFMDYIGPMLVSNENIKGIYGVDSDLDFENNVNFKSDRVLFYNLVEMQMNLHAHMEFLSGYEQGIQIIIEDIDKFLRARE